MPTEPMMGGAMGGMMGGMGGAPKVPSGIGAGPGDMGAEEDKEKGSITAVKDLLTQAMDMLSTLETEESGAEDIGSGPAGLPPSGGIPPARPPMNLRG